MALGDAVIIVTANLDEFRAEIAAGVAEANAEMATVGNDLGPSLKTKVLLGAGAIAGLIGPITAVTAAVTGITGALSLIGPAASLQYVNVRKAFAPLKVDLQKDFASLGDAFIKPMESAAKALVPSLKTTFAELRPAFATLAPSFNAFAQLAIAELPKLAKAFQPVIVVAGQLLNGALKDLPGVFNSLNKGVAGLAPLMAKFGPDLGLVIHALGDLAGPFKLLFDALLQAATVILPRLLPVLDALAKQISPAFGTAVAQLASAFGKVGLALIPTVPVFGQFVVDALKLIGPLSTLVSDLAPIAPAILALYAASVLAGPAIAILTFQFGLLDAAIDGNPIGLLAEIILALGVAFVEAYQHSTKFHDIVNTIVNDITGAWSAAFKGLADLVIDSLQAILRAAADVASTLSNVPGFGFLKGMSDQANGAAADLGSLQSKIDSLHGTNLDVNVTETFTSSYGASSSNNLGGSLSGRQAAAAAIAQGLPDPALALVNAAPATKAQTGGLVTKASGTKAATPAQTAAKALSADLKAALADVATDTAKQIQTSWDKLVKDLTTAGDKALAKSASSVEASLEKLSKARDIVTSNLTTATQNLDALTAASTSLNDSIKANVVSLGDMSQSQGWVTFQSITDHLTTALQTTKDFNAAIKTLVAEGLNKDTLNQLLAAGPAALATAQAYISGGQAGINQVNSLAAQLNAQGSTLGTQGSNAMYAAGIQAAQGLVNGLKSQEAALEKQMTQLATVMVNTIKKQLKIKSPSQVMFDEVGVQVGAGIAQGVMASGPSLTAASQSTHQSLTAGIGGAGGDTYLHVDLGEGISQVVKIQTNRKDRGLKAMAKSGSTVGNLSGRVN